MARPLWEQYGSVSAYFADDRGDRLHSGTDFNSFRLAEEFTTPVWGPVIRNGGDSVFGNYTIQRIEALNGLAGVNWYLLFGHQDSRSPHPYGHWLNPDDFMGWVGMTGQVAGANPWHLHVGLAYGDDTIGPSAFWAGGATLHDPLPVIRAAIDGHPWDSPWGPVWVNGTPETPLGPKQRRASKALNIRSAPSTAAPITGAFPAGGVLDVEAFEHGESVEGNGIWFYRDGQFFWSGAFEDQGTHDLPERVATPAPTPEPLPDPEPTPEPEEPDVPTPTPTPTPLPDISDTAATNTDNLHASGETKAPDAPLAGLMSKYPRVRFWGYVAFATTLLVLSLVPDALMAGIIPADMTEEVTRWTFFLTSAMTKIGAAFGFVAASNTARTKN